MKKEIKKDKRPSFSKLLKQAAIGFAALSPMLIATIALVGLFQVFVTPKMLSSLFTGNPIHDTLIGTIAGAIAVGQAIISYILGGELLHQGVSIYAVTAFVLSWVTLGIVQLPVEAKVLGLRFTIYRNLLALIFTVIISVCTVWTLKALG